jgi:hypothetical protein
VKHQIAAVLVTFSYLSSVALQAQSTITLSSKEIPNVNGTADVTVNATLPPAPPTFNLTGLVTGTAAFYIGVTATTTDGASSYSGAIDFATNNYLVKVPAGTYLLSVSYVASLSGATAVSNYNDPAQVPVTADTVHPITVVSTATHNISGLLSGLDPRLPSTNFIFSNIGANGGFSLGLATVKRDGTYTSAVPDGNYAALLLAGTKDASRVTSINLGNLTVAGADVVANFTAPALSSLSGTVQTSDGTTIQTASSVIGFDGTLQSLIQNPNSTNYPLFSFGSGSIDDTSGQYQLLLSTGRQYTLVVALNIFASTPVQAGGLLEFILPGTTPLPTDTTQNIIIPALPGTVIISGQVTDPNGAPVIGATVSATSMQVSGLPINTVIFSRDTQTDSSGKYKVTVLNGSNYDLIFTPPVSGLTGGLNLVPNHLKTIQRLTTPSVGKNFSRLSQ